MGWAWVSIAVAIFMINSVTAQQSPWSQEVSECDPYKNWTYEETCTFVKINSDSCEGGGYLLWAKYVECTDSSVGRIFIIIIGTVFMLFLFIVLSSAGDDFFSPNVAAIVNHLKISESVAGVTFLAFGNGAPDIFSSIASVLSTPDPKANLALGELLGGNVFVPLMVTATIILTSPFEVDAISTTRDLIFFLIAVGLLLFYFLYSQVLSVWEPAVFLGLYVLYVITVIVIEKFFKTKKKDRDHSIVRTRTVSRCHTIVPEINIATVVSDALDKIQQTAKNESNGNVSTHDRIQTASIFPPMELPSMFGHGEEEEDEVLVIHGHVYRGDAARSRAASTAPPPIQNDAWSVIIQDLLDHLRCFPKKEEWDEMNMFEKVLSIIKIIPMFIFKATIPLSENSWSKAGALIHAVLDPCCFLFCIKMFLTVPGYGGPGLWLYGLVLSAVFVILILVFTKYTEQPKYYKETYSYLGFLMAVAWIYMIAAEVVNVVSMIGIISGISHEILGLTILAWSNSIGDLIADVSVVKQGYPRMAMAAAIGGPLFNLLIGFGLPFTIALANPATKPINIIFGPTFHLLILFLGIALITLLVGIFVQKFYVRRPFAIILIAIYVCFIIMVALDASNVVVWN